MTVKPSKVFEFPPLEDYGRWLQNLLDWTEARVELVWAYWNRDTRTPFKFVSLLERSAARPGISCPLTRLSSRPVDLALLSRVSELQHSLADLSAAADAVISPLSWKLGILSKCNGHRFLVSALELIESFLWPGRQQWRYERFQEKCDHFRKLLSAFRRDYLMDAAGVGTG